MAYSLRDGWSTHGTSIDEFREELKDLDGRTYFIEVNSSELTWFTKQDSFPGAEPDKIYFTTWKEDEGRSRFMAASPDVLMRDCEEALKSELDRGKNIIVLDGKAYFLSPGLIESVKARLNIKGDPLSVQSPKRDEFICERFVQTPFNGIMAVRTDGKVAKAFAIHSDKYGNCPQEILADIADTMEIDLGDMEVKGWDVSNFFSEIRVEFPKKAEDISSLYGLPNVLTPGLLLQTSDTGDSSITAIGTWSIDGKYSHIQGGVFRRKHRGDIDVDHFIERVQKEIFVEYTKVPETLYKLLTIDIPSASVKGIVEEVIKDIDFKSNKLLGKKRAKNIEEDLVNEINPAISYTAYDIAMMMMTIPQRIIGEGLNKTEFDNLSKAVLKGVFFDYEKALKGGAIHLI